MSVIYVKKCFGIEKCKRIERDCYRLLAKTISNDMWEAIEEFTVEEMKELVADLVELRIGRKKSGEKVKLIRRRKSYIRFMDLAKALQTKLEVSNEKICDVLDIHVLVMDEVQAFGSQRNASLAYESLQQVKEDLRGEK